MLYDDERTLILNWCITFLTTWENLLSAVTGNGGIYNSTTLEAIH